MDNNNAYRIRLRSLLKKLPIRESVKNGWLGNICQIASCIDIAFADEIVAWLTPIYNTESRRRVDECLKSIVISFHQL